MKADLSSLRINTLFYLSYILMLFGWMFENILYIKEILPFVRIISYLLCIIVIMNNYKKFTYKKITINIIITILILVSSVYSNSNKILALWLFILASENVNFNKLVKIDFCTKCIFTILIITLYYFGLSNISEFTSYNGQYRSSLGFSNPNTFGYYMFSICADFVYIKTNKYNFLHFIFLFIIAIIVSEISLSRTSSYLIIIMAIISIFSSLFKKILLSDLFKKVMIMMFATFTILSFVVSSKYSMNNELLYKFNHFLSGRIVNSYKYINKYDIKLFGQEIAIKTYSGDSTLYLDNAYIKLLLNEGVISFLLILTIYNKTIKKAYLHKNNLLIGIIFIYMCYGIFENSMFWITGNIFLLYIFGNHNCDMKLITDELEV